LLKNLHEVFVLGKVAGKTAKEVLADGKVNAFDLPKLVQLWEPAKDALDGISEIPAELDVSKLTTADIQLIINDAVELAQIWMSVFTKAA